MEEDRRERRLVHLRRLRERLQDRPDVRHRGRVDLERPRPVGPHPRPAISLPEADEHGDRDDRARPDPQTPSCNGLSEERRTPRPEAATGATHDSYHGHWNGTACTVVGSRPDAARSSTHRRRARGAARADRRRERRPARRVDGDVGAGPRAGCARRSPRPAPPTSSTGREPVVHAARPHRSGRC